MSFCVNTPIRVQWYAPLKPPLCMPFKSLQIQQTPLDNETKLPLIHDNLMGCLSHRLADPFRRFHFCLHSWSRIWSRTRPRIRPHLWLRLRVHLLFLLILLEHQSVVIEGEVGVAQIAVEPVLLHLQLLPPVLVLQNQHVVRLLRRLRGSEHAADVQRLVLGLLPGVNHQRHVRVLRRGELPEGVDGPLLRVEALVAGGGAEEELEVVEDDVLHVVRVHAVLHRVQNLLDLRAPEEPQVVQRQLLEALRDRLVLLVRDLRGNLRLYPSAPRTIANH